MSLLAVVLLSIWGATRGRGPFATGSAADDVLFLQLFLIAISLPLFFLAALVEERQEKAKVLSDALGGREEVEIVALEGDTGAEVVVVRDGRGAERRVPLAQVREARLAFHW